MTPLKPPVRHQRFPYVEVAVVPWGSTVPFRARREHSIPARPVTTSASIVIAQRREMDARVLSLGAARAARRGTRCAARVGARQSLASNALEREGSERCQIPRPPA